MNRSVYVICMVVALFLNACRNKSSMATVQQDQDTVITAAIVDRDSTGTEVAAPVVLTDTVVSKPAPAAEQEQIDYADSVDFKKYAAPVVSGTKAEIDWSSNINARRFKTRIINGYTDSVNFAGHYIGTVFGCGAGCALGFMVDTRDGKIYDFPLGEENSCIDMQDAALFRGFSRLFISAVCKNSEDQKLYFKAYVWEEQNKRFDRVKEKDFVKK